MTNALDRTIELLLSQNDGKIADAVASIDDCGDLIVFGRGPEGYEHWVVVGEEEKDIVLLELLRERFTAVPSAEFMEWLEGHGINHEVGSVAGEHRGAARVSAKGRRRNGSGRTKTMRAGP
jgi:hypothetical protein